MVYKNLKNKTKDLVILKVCGPCFLVPYLYFFKMLYFYIKFKEINCEAYPK